VRSIPGITRLKSIRRGRALYITPSRGCPGVHAVQELNIRAFSE
jgi:hypothetical protein